MAHKNRTKIRCFFLSLLVSGASLFHKPKKLHIFFLFLSVNGDVGMVMF